MSKNIFTDLGYTLSACQSLESSVYEMCTYLMAIEALPQGGGLSEDQLESHSETIRKKCKGMSFHSRIEKIRKIAPKVFSKEFTETLIEAKNIRNEIAHTYMSENSFMLFTPSNLNKLGEDLNHKHEILTKAHELFFSKCEKLSSTLGLDFNTYWSKVKSNWSTDYTSA